MTVLCPLRVVTVQKTGGDVTLTESDLKPPVFHDWRPDSEPVSYIQWYATWLAIKNEWRGPFMLRIRLLNMNTSSEVEYTLPYIGPPRRG